MADLDDFFAKKDRKKSRGKKFLTADELVKNLEDTSKRDPVKPKRETGPAATIPLNNTNSVSDDGENIGDQVVPNDEEWKEIEPEGKKDYTGLKILQLNCDGDRESQNIGDGGGYDDEDNTDGSEQNAAPDPKEPWKKVVPSESSTTRKYVAPINRMSAIIPGSRTTKLRKTAPDITNEEYFPTLGAARPEEQKKKKNEPAYEEVRNGVRINQRTHDNTILAPSAIANRFKSLEEVDS